MGDQADFATRFHNLEGDTIGDRTKSLFKLIRTPALFANDEQLESALQSLKPKSYQENLFYIDTLIFFKRTKELTEFLKGGNDVYISKILKQPWFFHTVFENVDAETLVTDFLPNLSYGVRKKFINRISNHWNEQKMDLLFEALEKRYGLPQAVIILHKCTATKIKTVLEQTEIKLSPNQIVNIFNKSEELFMNYLDRNQGKCDNDKVLKHIAISNPELLLKLEQEKKISLYTVGRRTSKGILKIVKDDIQTNSARYLRFLNKAVVVRQLGKNFETLFKTMFPQKIERINMYTSGCQLLRYYPKNGRWNLFKRTFTQIFTEQELNKLLLHLNSLKELNPPRDVIESWAELHYKQQEGDYKSYLKYYEASKAFPLIKEKINVTSDIYERQSLVCLMIEACKDPKDLDTLVEVLKYICFRHRNEEPSVRKRILYTVKSSFKLEDLNENHWKCIDEQIKILRIQKEHSLSENGDFIEKHLEYLVKTGKDHKPLLLEYIKDMYSESYCRRLEYEDFALAKKIYTEIIEQLGEVVKTDYEQDRKFKDSVLDNVLVFCREHPEFCIKLADFPVLVQFIQQVFNKTNEFDNIDKHIIAKVISHNVTFPQYAVDLNTDIFVIILKVFKQQNSLGQLTSLFREVILTKSRDSFANKMFEFYFQNVFDANPDKTIFLWFLKHEPKVLISHMSTITDKSAVLLSQPDYRLIKHYTHLGIDKTLADFYIKQLDSGNALVPRNPLSALCALLSTDDFVRFVSERYLPKKDKLDLLDEEMRDIFNVQCEVAKQLANVNEPYKMLPTIMKFCRGDYLQSALPSMYKAFYRSPEKILYSYIEALSKQAVSARKHAIFLSCELLDKQHTLNLLKSTEESNVSSQKYLFSATLKYFLKNPSEDLLDKVVESMNSIDVNDKETLDSLKDVSIPIKYRARYIEKCWKFFEGLVSKGVKIREYLSALLNHMSADITLTLSESFITDIIKRYFPDVEGRISNIDEFVVRVLKTRTSDRSQNLQTVFQILLESSPNARASFFNTFLHSSHFEMDQQLVNKFAEHWCKNFSMIDTFDQHIAIKLAVFKCENPSHDDFAAKVVNYLEQLITEYGFHVYDRFNDELKRAVDYRDLVEQYKFYLAVLKCKTTPTTCILVLNNIMNQSDDEIEELRNVFNEIINIIKNVETPIVRVYFNAFILDNGMGSAVRPLGGGRGARKRSRY